jgi:hypothetical protein
MQVSSQQSAGWRCAGATVICAPMCTTRPSAAAHSATTSAAGPCPARDCSPFPVLHAPAQPASRPSTHSDTMHQHHRHPPALQVRRLPRLQRGRVDLCVHLRVCQHRHGGLHHWWVPGGAHPAGNGHVRPGGGGREGQQGRFRAWWPARTSSSATINTTAIRHMLPSPELSSYRSCRHHHPAGHDHHLDCPPACASRMQAPSPCSSPRLTQPPGSTVTA